ncbi:MAG: cytochrome P450 [Nocardiopsaceae bacterium]|nr:cytochrome P450 [Nocardiopsaceae bacterium]
MSTQPPSLGAHHGLPPVKLYTETVPTVRMWTDLLERYGPIAPAEIEPGATGWLVLGFEENRRVLTDTATFARDPGWWRELQDGTIGPESGLRALYSKRPSAVFCDGEEHQRYRKAILTAFAQLSEQQILHHVGEAAGLLIDAFCLHRKADLIAQFARQVPLTVLCRLLGLGPGDTAEVCAAMQTVWEAGPDAPAARQELEQLLIRFSQEKRRNPQNDIISGLIAAGMDDAEVCGQVTTLISAGDEPVTQLIGNTLRMLLTDRTTRGEFQSAVSMINETVNTSLWRDPPFAMVVGRYPTRDVTIGQYHVRRGDCLVLGYGAAHADLIRRGSKDMLGANRAHLAWGAGPHTCPEAGRQMALTIAETAVEKILQRLPDIQLAVDPDQLKPIPSMSIHGVVELPVVYKASAPEGARGGSQLWARPQSTMASVERQNPTRPPSRGGFLSWLLPTRQKP